MNKHDLPIRIMVFPARPDCLLLYVPEETTLRLPELRPPFTKYDVASACGEAGLNVRVAESTPGRWTASYQQARLADRAERAQRQREQEAARVVEIKTSTSASTTAKAHAEVLARKNEVDDQIRNLKTELSEARSRARTHGEYLPARIYQQKETLVERLKRESQAFQVRLGELRVQQKEENRREQQQEAEAFVHAAYGLLPQTTVDQIWAHAGFETDGEVGTDEAGEDEDDHDAQNA